MLRRSSSRSTLPLLLLLLIGICSLWIYCTSWYFERDIRDPKISTHTGGKGGDYIWILLQDVDLLKDRDEALQNRIGRLSVESVIIGNHLDDFIQVWYPLTGWIRHDNQSLLRVETLTENPNNVLSFSKSVCSDVISILPDSSSIEKILSWENQWPIGNGRWGALVGGSYSVNIIPLSLAGFFVGPSRPISSDVSDYSKYVNLSRSWLMTGKFDKSQMTMSSVIRSQPMSTFQSIFDMIFVFLPDGLKQFSPRSPNESPGMIKSRIELFHEIQTFLYGKPLPLSDGIFSTQNSRLLYERNTLNTRDGVTRSHHIIASGYNASLEYQVHSRSWFASSVDNVIVGKFECATSTRRKGCINVALRPTRDKRLAQVRPIFRVTDWAHRRDYNSFVFHDIPPRRISPHSSIAESDLIVITASIHQSAIPSELFPEVEFCSVLSCLQGKPQVVGEYLLCTNSNEMIFLASVVSVTSEKPLALARTECWNIVEDAFFRGYRELYRNHIKKFSGSMSQSELCIGCDEQSPINPDILFLNKFQWFSKYILYSSSQRTVSNLQGIWADGPTSAWNGDYHLNINLQMTYWPIYSMGISDELISPLIKFLEHLSSSGGDTAKKLYRCDGWVAHAFTDNSLDAGVLGDLEWSLCGAWLALHLWEHLTYDYSSQFLMETFLPTFEGISNFFKGYMFLGPDGNMHTGPTTSPENSYRVNTLTDEESVFSQIALSPAFDMSILRQSCNAYLIGTRWGLSDPDLQSDPAILLMLNEHLRHAREFCRLISKMKNNGNPIIDRISNTLVEYPVKDWSNTTLVSEFSGETSVRLEPTDWGHRHFSSLHWLYPGNSLPMDTSRKELFAVAEKTLKLKVESGGGHTGWSAAWEACLWSRLRNSDLALAALLKVFQRYTAPNFMGLHPALVGTDPSCRTCFTHDYQNQVLQRAPKRGLTDKYGSVFQIDSNSGGYAAISEMIIQSHLPHIIHLLPSLPVIFSHSGKIRSWTSRGGLRVSMDWKMGNIECASIILQKPHPWFTLNIVEIRQGYYDISNSTENEFFVISPNELTVSSSSGCLSSRKSIKAVPVVRKHNNDHVLEISLHSFPCEIYLCSKSGGGLCHCQI